MNKSEDKRLQFTTDQAREAYPGRPDAWYDGFRNGAADKLLGIQLDVAIHPDGNRYGEEYTRGYRVGQIVNFWGGNAMKEAKAGMRVEVVEPGAVSELNLGGGSARVKGTIFRLGEKKDVGQALVVLDGGKRLWFPLTALTRLFSEEEQRP